MSVEDVELASIGSGLLVFLGVEHGDTTEIASRLANKTASLRIFPSDSKPMDTSVVDVDGSVLVVSQFTLAADVSKGNRPNFSDAAEPSVAEPLVNEFIEVLRQRVPHVVSGRFGADMQVALVNDGPVTLLLHQA